MTILPLPRCHGDARRTYRDDGLVVIRTVVREAIMAILISHGSPADLTRCSDKIGSRMVQWPRKVAEAGVL